MFRGHHRLPSYSPGIAARLADPFYVVLRKYRPMPVVRPYRTAIGI
ncbi:MAG TPA: hypothetical protein VLC74_11645 [Rhizomicrobium sp.]|nr:hypothetical protein [Rhizomicrobium sp.]